MGCAASAPEPQSKLDHQHGGYPRNAAPQKAPQQQQHAQQPPPRQQQQQQQQPQQQPQHHQQQPQQPPPQQPVQQQQQQPPARQVNTQNQAEPEVKVKQVMLDRKVLERYLELEQLTRSSEGRNVIKTVKAKEEELVDLSKSVKQLDDHYRQCVKETEKEHADVKHMETPSVKGYFVQQEGNDGYDAAMSKEQEEYLEALNKQEIAKKELEGVTRQRDQVSSEVKSMQEEVKQLQKLYTEQDELLASIFNGKYGSEKEYQLECELDLLQDRKQRISVAKYKWTNGRVLLQHAVNQLAFACKRWTEINKVRPENMQVRYTMATETRNNVIAASQNITSAQRYLHTIQFPYCKPPEVDTLNRAVNNIYSDMNTPDRHKHALQCYSTTHKRSAALLQWFDHVIANTIKKDYDRANEAQSMKSRELRAERLMLIKTKIKESGNDANLDIEGENDVPGPAAEELVETHTYEPDNVSSAGDVELPNMPDEGTNEETGESSSGDSATPLPLNELAPAPNQDELFGDIDELKKQHQHEMQEFSKAQDVNKARMEQGLQEKLRARRSRRNRQDIADQANEE